MGGGSTRRHRSRRSRRNQSTRQKAGVHNISNNEKNLQAVLLYERFPEKTRKISHNVLTIGERIGRLIHKQPPLTASLLVWRGQFNETIDPHLNWFSTSLRDDVARSYSTKNLFKIHLQPGIRVLNMYQYYDEHGIKDPVKEANAISKLFQFKNNEYFTTNDYTQFQEVLVEKGGSFWADPEKTQKGFRWIGKVHPTEAGTLEDIHDMEMDVYETYYFPN